MKLLRCVCFGAVVFVVSCSNQASDNNTTRDTADDTTTAVPATPSQEYAAPPSKAKAEDAVKTDTSKTSISIGNEGARVKTKKGTDVSYDKQGIKIDQKDVKIDIRRDSL